MDAEQFLEESRRVLLACSSESFEHVAAHLERMETQIATAERDKLEAQAWLLRLRLTALQLCKRPLEEVEPFARALLEEERLSAFGRLQSIGAFAAYCRDRGRPDVGVVFLEDALSRVDWATVTAVLKAEARAAYGKLLTELRGYAGAP